MENAYCPSVIFEGYKIQSYGHVSLPPNGTKGFPLEQEPCLDLYLLNPYTEELQAAEAIHQAPMLVELLPSKHNRFRI